MTRRRISSPALIIGLLATALCSGAWAQETDGGGAGGSPDLPGRAETSDQPSVKEEKEPPSIQSTLGKDELRAFFATKGIAYSFTYIGETFGIASGGQRRGGIYEGRLDGQLDADLGKLFGWNGATLHANFYQIHGQGLSRAYLGNIFVASGIEALPSTRLFELWVEQKVGDTLSVRAGQLGADSEFIVSQYATLFVNSTFGFPGSFAADLPSGGPAYPLATPAARVKWAPSADLTLMGAVFNGNPAGPGPGDPQANDRSGLEFRTRDPALLIGEAAYTYNQGKDAAGLPGTLKLGGWFHAGRFNDLRRAAPSADATSLLLADPTSSGVARRLRGNQGVYVVFDQTLYRAPGTDDQGLGLFVRASASPGDRNLVQFYADGGLTYKGLMPNRPDDTAGIAFGYARISSAARGFDSDTAFFNPDTFSPIRSSEALIEITYQAQIIPGWTVQPDFQYVWRPGGNVLNPRNPFAVTKDAAIVGLRTSIRY